MQQVCSDCYVIATYTKCMRFNVMVHVSDCLTLRQDRCRNKDEISNNSGKMNDLLLGPGQWGEEIHADDFIMSSPGICSAWMGGRKDSRAQLPSLDNTEPRAAAHKATSSRRSDTMRVAG